MRVDLYTPLSVYEIARALKCPAPPSDAWIYGISISSKNIREGDLFVALKGEKNDGHRFVLHASKNGAAAVLCERDCPSFVSALKVENTLLALGNLASYFCNKQRHKTIAVTGSVGKSSTCAYVGTILKKRFKIHRTNGNYNNEIGVPLTMLSIKEDTDILLLEMGMNHEGEIEKLSKYAKPDMAMITNIGFAHVGLLGSREKVIKAKSEIVSGLAAKGILFAPYEETSLKNAHPQIRTFSLLNHDADYFFTFVEKNTAEISLLGEEKITFKTSPSEIVKNETALRAVSLAHSFFMPLKEIEEALHECTLPDGRQTVLEKKEKKIIDDSYNASPESMIAAFEKLNSLCVNGKKMALLGDMLELGNFADEWHIKIGEIFASFHFDKLFAVGEYGRKLIEGAKKGGMAEEQLLFLDSQDKHEIARFIKAIFDAGDALLIKASHALALNEVVNILF